MFCVCGVMRWQTCRLTRECMYGRVPIECGEVEGRAYRLRLHNREHVDPSGGIYIQPVSTQTRLPCL